MPPTTDVAVAERLEALESALARLESRVHSLEAGGAPMRRPPESAPLAAERIAPAEPAVEAPPALATLPALVGRTLVVLGGAFAFRSLTEGGWLSPAVGVGIGVAYAFVWLWFADRAALRGDALGGAFHALASALIVYPLLVDATARLALLPPVAAAPLLIAANAAGLAVAWRRGSRAFAWIQQVASVSVAALLLFRTRSVLAFGCALLVLAVGSLWLAYARGWRGQRWWVALGLDLVVALLTALWLFGRTPPDWLDRSSLMALQIALAAIYLGAFVLRLMFQERRVTAFAVTQTVLVLVFGFEAAIWISTPSAQLPLAIGALALAVALHALLARRAEARVGHGAAVAYFSSVATFLAAEAIRVLTPAAAPLVWLVGGVVVASLTWRRRRPVFELHAAALTAAALAASGTLRSAAGAILLPARAVWSELPAATPLLVALSAGVVVLLYRGTAEGLDSRLSIASRALSLSVTAIAAAGVATRALASPLGAAGPQADPGHLATVRTVVGVVAATALAFAARRLRRPELPRLAAVVLALGAVKLLLEDFRQGDATDLLVSLALYGAALIAVPKLARRPPPSDGEPQRSESNHSRAS